MARNLSHSGNRVGSKIEVKLTLNGADLVPGEKWNVTITGLALNGGEQEVPAGATGSHEMTWTSSAPLTAGATSIQVKLWKVGPPDTNLGTTQIDILPVASPPALPSTTPPPATTAPPAGSSVPLQVQVVGSPSKFLSWAPILTLIASIMGVFLCLGFVCYLLWLFAGQVAGTSAGVSVDKKDSVHISVEMDVNSNDPAVHAEAVKAVGSITH
ncbi:hypothetical protein HQ487_03715 [Candidatus Uhrbacteria bacterium]|nr:hypothetical protein [Candidatus Uhrbacteria bacterium]